MILTENDNLEITQKNIIKQKDLRAIIFKYNTINKQYTTLDFHMSNFENEPFIVDWQLSMDEKAGGD